MNTNAVAMAADSAGTVGLGTPHKQTYNTASKIFQISHDHSVGVMIYENLSLHSVPWETIIKTYRETLSADGFPTLDGYARDFLKFLEKRNEYFVPRYQQDEALKNVCASVLEDFLAEWQSLEGKKTMQNFLLSKTAGIDETQSIVSQWRNKKEIDSVINEQMINSEFIKLINSAYYNALYLAILNYIIRSNPFGYTGIVFAGFGSEDLFPCAYSFEVCGYYLGNLLVKDVKDNIKITHENDALIFPYAQTEMVHTFMRGIHPEHDALIKQTILDIVEPMPELLTNKILSEITELSDAQKDKIKKRLFSKINSGDDIDLTRGMDANLEHHFASYARKILDGVTFLSKEELADVAGAMLRLVTLQKQVTRGDDSVGGPIDVAVISKGDGFVWINRKHYFEKHLNPQFFKRFRGKK